MTPEPTVGDETTNNGDESAADGIRTRNGRKLEFEIMVPISSQIRRRAAVILQDQFKRLGTRVN